jgi:hypothetical protein
MSSKKKPPCQPRHGKHSDLTSTNSVADESQLYRNVSRQPILASAMAKIGAQIAAETD